MLCMACIFPSGNESLSVELTVKPDVSRRNDSAGEITSWEGRRSRRCIPLRDAGSGRSCTEDSRQVGAGRYTNMVNKDITIWS
jgi:hypothetical protein